MENIILSREQQVVIDDNDGIVCCSAVAGSGKTHTLIMKIASLIGSNIQPESIMCCTFSKKAADSMSSRLQDMVGEEIVQKVKIGTMHSIFFSIIRQELPDRRFIVMNDDDQLKVLNYACKKLKIRLSKSNKLIVYNMIKMMKNTLITPEKANQIVNHKHSSKLIEIVNVYNEYEIYKRLHDYIDFEDMLIMAYNLLSVDEVLDRWQSRWQYILVDEYQDINAAQNEIIKLLSKKAKLLFLVGDKNQAIYAFRGANPFFIQNVKNEFQGVKIRNLPKTYRCSDNIVIKANKLIDIMGGVKMVSNRLDGRVVNLGGYVSKLDEAHDIATKIKEIQDIDKNKDIMVLYRTNNQAISIERALADCHISFQSSNDKLFFDVFEIKDMLAYMKIINSPNDSISAYMRIMNHPYRGITDDMIKKWKHMVVMEGKSCLDALALQHKHSNHNMPMQRLWYELNIMINKSCRVGSLGEIIGIIRRITKYDKWLGNIITEDDIDNDISLGKLDNMNEFAKFADGYDDISSLLSKIIEIRGLANCKNAKVQVMTIHKSKGLEADIVFVAGVNNKLLPHKNNDVEEEMRLFYVAITRAREAVYLSYFGDKSEFLDLINL